MKTYPESRLTDLLIEFDEMGFCPTTVCPNPEQTAIEWKEQIVKEIQKLQAENTELRARLDKAVELPVKLGGDVYSVRWSKDNPKDGIVTEECVSRIEVDSSSGFAIHTIEYEPLLSFSIYYNVDWNDTVFATRAEAEARLKELREVEQ